MVLMKNPRDSYQAQVLSRQIMGDKARKFMDMYRRGTARPHGYLVVDLKQETTDGEKLKIDIFGENLEALVPLVKEEPTYPMAPSYSMVQQPNPLVISMAEPMASAMTYQGCTLPTQPWDECLKKESGVVSSKGLGYPPGIPCDRDNRMLSCAYCGFVFETYRDLEKHEERCDADSSSSEEEDEVPPMKKLKEGTDEWDAWFSIRSRVGEAYRDTINKEQKKYMKEGYAASPAKKKAQNDVHPEARKDMRTALVREWLRWHKLKQTPYFKKIDTTARRLKHMEDLSWEEAWSDAVRRHKVLFEYILPDHKVPSDDKENEPEESDMEDEDVSEEEEEEEEEEDN
jgi:hypothetical protein